MQNRELEDLQPSTSHEFPLARVLVLAAIACITLITFFYNEFMADPISFWQLKKAVASDNTELLKVLASDPALSEQRKSALLGIAVANSSADTLRFLLALSNFADPGLLASARDKAVKALRPDLLPLLLSQSPPENPPQWAAQQLSEAAVGNGTFISHPEEGYRRILVTKQLLEQGALASVNAEELASMKSRVVFSEVRDLLNEYPVVGDNSVEPAVASAAEKIGEKLLETANEKDAVRPEVTP